MAVNTDNAPEPAAQLENLRRDYTQGGLARKDLEADPFAQFKRWFAQAQKAGLIEPNAMTLCTADAAGCPNARTVLLKDLDEGFVFYTNYNGTKAREIGENPEVALLFPWLALERQVKVLGRAEKISTAQSLAYFLKRPLASRLGAWASPQSQVIKTRALLEQKFEEAKRKFSDGQIPLPDHWGGFRVVPRLFEFWQGRTSRLHDRFQYTLHAGTEPGWRIERLGP
ncbi:MAG: pyridoxamine 5'-phosphate oxidase [Opitutales bacterium]